MASTRQSNIELLRIVAMLLVLILHANGIAIGLPDQADCNSNPGLSLSRLFIESLCIVCVNVYVIISGWFGINASPRKLAGFIFTCLFYSLLLTVVIWAMKGFPSMSFKTVAGCFLFGQDYWFANSYLLLCIISPALNSFFEHCNRRIVRFTICAFFLMMMSFGWLQTMPEFKSGYSTISFIGLYMLGRYMNIYTFGEDNNVISKPMALAGYLICALLLTAMAYIVFKMGAEYYISRCVFSYLNPLSIAASVCLFLFFNKLEFTSDFVNIIARSTFAVYLFHLNPFIWIWFINSCRSFNSKLGAVSSLCIAGLIVMVFAIAILVDQIRIKSWKWVDNNLLTEKRGTSE